MSNTIPKLLIVDDVKGSLFAHKMILKDLGAEAICIQNPHDVFAALKEHEIDVFILDIEMPGLDGIELAKLIREIPGADRKPIVFVSAMRNMEIVFKGQEKAPVECLYKPVDDDQFKKLVAKHLGWAGFAVPSSMGLM